MATSSATIPSPMNSLPPVATLSVSPSTPPLKKEFMNPQQRYASLLNSNIGEVKVIEGNPKWDMLTYNKEQLFDWYFAPNNESHNIIVAAITTNDAYELGDDFLQYFTEPDLFNIKKRTYPSVAEFYTKNFPLIQAKALELKNLDTDAKMPDRFYLNEAIYKLPEIKRIKPMRISTALAIFRYFNSKVILDPNGEFFGRMMAAAISGATVYHALNPKGYLCADEMIRFLNKPNFYVAGEGIDIFTPNVVEENAYDTVFTNLIFFEEEEVLWAKIRGYPWWPAFVPILSTRLINYTQITEEAKPNIPSFSLGIILSIVIIITS